MLPKAGRIVRERYHQKMRGVDESSADRGFVAGARRSRSEFIRAPEAAKEIAVLGRELDDSRATRMRARRVDRRRWPLRQEKPRSTAA